MTILLINLSYEVGTPDLVIMSQVGWTIKDIQRSRLPNLPFRLIPLKGAS